MTLDDAIARWESALRVARETYKKPEPGDLYDQWIKLLETTVETLKQQQLREKFDHYPTA